MSQPTSATAKNSVSHEVSVKEKIEVGVGKCIVPGQVHVCGSSKIMLANNRQDTDRYVVGAE